MMSGINASLPDHLCGIVDAFHIVALVGKED